MAAPIGATEVLRFTWIDGPDGPPMPFPPEEDMYLVFGEEDPVRAYVIKDVRPMTRSPKPHRYALTCMRIDPDDVPEDALPVPCTRGRRRPR